ncbi:MAG: hypothetical protein QOE41_978 [Mycobacterium sp.]|jgi:hypothetical protein|nr:hypothetical protein [Mycobacterium sp.]MDT5131667.1 hypothetical protein [Mycobacterium sp.]
MTSPARVWNPRRMTSYTAASSCSTSPNPLWRCRRWRQRYRPADGLVIEEGDFGLLEFAGAAESPRASIVLRDVFTRWAAAGVIDSYLGRRLPGLVGALDLEAFGVDAFTQIGGPGDPAYETFRLAWPATRAGAAAVGLTEDDLRCVDGAFANFTVLVGVTIFAAWGQLPRPSDKRSSHM